MAMSDYCLCDVCGEKAFYDATVTDSRYTGWDDWTDKRVPEEDTVLFACVCVDCRGKYKIIVAKREEE